MPKDVEYSEIGDALDLLHFALDLGGKVFEDFKVATDDLAIAIGRKGQNARLTSRLIGWRIDIEEFKAAGDDPRGNAISSLVKFLSLDPAIAGRLVDMGITSPAAFEGVGAEDLVGGGFTAEEAQAIDAVFSARSKPLPVVAAKSYFGNLGAGSGMVELIASLLALEHDRLFPILNYATPDPACPVSPVRNGDVPPGPSFINLSVTPQGQASAAMVRRFE